MSLAGLLTTLDDDPQLRAVIARAQSQAATGPERTSATLIRQSVKDMKG